jgi:hypothetical protein
MLSNLKTFWQETFWQSRVALVILALALAVHILSLLGVATSDWLFVVFPLHIGIMALVVTAIPKMMYATFADPDRSPLSNLPYASGQLVVLSLALAIYAVIWFAGTFVYYGEGEAILKNGQYIWLAPTGSGRSISPAQFRNFGTITIAVFSACWAAFALPLAIGHDRLTRRIRQARRGRAASA